MIKNLGLLIFLNVLILNSGDPKHRKQSKNYLLYDKTSVYEDPNEVFDKLKKIKKIFGNYVLRVLYEVCNNNVERYKLGYDALGDIPIMLSRPYWDDSIMDAVETLALYNRCNGNLLCIYFDMQQIIAKSIKIQKKCFFCYEVTLINPITGEIESS